ncbi:MAG: thioredoxin family protein [Chloroflexi bacterium]|nr:thioredoxin family protein [Chloroflexota bacterium]
MFLIADVAARWAGGKTFEQYVAAMQHNREKLETLMGAIELSAAERAPFAAMRGPLYGLAVTEDWCPDCTANIPVLMKVAAAHPSLAVRFVGREANWDLLAHAKKGERMAIPTFFFFDAQWHAIGHWVERPLKVEALLNEWAGGHMPAGKPDFSQPAWREYGMNKASFYQNELFINRGLWRETVEELRAILAGETISNVAALAATA